MFLKISFEQKSFDSLCSYNLVFCKNKFWLFQKEMQNENLNETLFVVSIWYELYISMCFVTPF